MKVVTLTGTIGTRGQKKVAGDISGSATGVEDVFNRLEVQRAAGSSSSPA